MSHMRGIRLCGAFALCALSLTACAEFYPRFDSLLNPDIRELRSVEVVDAVRCAVSKFLTERHEQIVSEAGRKAEMYCSGSRSRWRFKSMDYSQSKRKCLPNNDPTTANPVDCVPAYHVWKYERYQEEGQGDDESNPTRRKVCVANGGCWPGTVPKGNNACTLDDDSRFALDPNSSATIELALTANNQGFMNYTRLDPEQLGWLKNFIASGNNPPGTPFPSLQIKSKAQNVVTMKIVMPQSRWIEEEKPDKVRDKAVLEKVKKAKEAIAKKTEDKLREDEELRRFLRSRGGARILGAEIVGSLALPPDERPAFTPQALKALQNERNRGVDENCGRRDIDFAGLRRLLEKFVVEREQGLFEGAPDVSLDEMVLTTSFQITLDASAGTYHIFRFFPVLIPPTLNLNPDHTNQLKITFKGVKGRANPRNREALRQKCLTRLQGVVGATQECNTPNSLLLESLIEAVEGSKSGG